MKVSVYIDDGRVFEYEVATPEKGREHAAAIIRGGYRHNDGNGEFEHYPPHRIDKVKLSGQPVQTKYPDVSTGT